MGLQELIDRFEHPDTVFGPTPLWWWSGEKVTSERLRWQLDRFHEGGIDSLVVINLAPSGPTYGAPADDPAWFSDEWWTLLEDVCDHMEPLGMKLWFYDQIGFSGANLQGRITQTNPWARGEKLAAHWLVVGDDGCLTVPAGQRLVAAFDHARRHLGPYDDREVDLRPGQQVLAVCAVPTSFDYLSVDAFALLQDLVHGEFERRVPQHLGRTIVGSFQDELPATNAWTPTFPEAFRSRRGYDLLPDLYRLFEGSDAQAQKVRGDYYGVRTELTEEAVFKPLYAFHQRHGLLNGADQSNPARAAYPIQSTQIYTDYFRTHRWINAVGSDHEGDAHAHASLARLHGHDHVWIESFHSSGWGGTLEETWDWLVPFLRAGATIYNPHASYYSTVAGTFEWAPPSTDWRQPYWGQYGEFARAVARTASVLSWGAYQARVGVLHPTTTVQAEVPVSTPIKYFTDMSGEPALPADLARTDASQDAYLALCGSTNWFKPLPGLLDGAGIAFDVVDDDSLQHAAVTQGEAEVAYQHYDTVVLPGCRVLETATARTLVELLDRGGRVVCVGDRPTLAAGRGGDDDLVKRLAEHPDLIVVADPQAAVVAIGRNRDLATTDAPLQVRSDGTTGVALVVGCHPMATVQIPGPGRSRIDFDRSRYATGRDVTIAAPVTNAEWWIPSTGERRSLKVKRSRESAQVAVPLDGAPAGILVWTSEELSPDGVTGTASEITSGISAEPIDLPDDWTGELVPTMDNTWGDLSRESDDHLTSVQLWQLADDRGETVDAGYGEQAVVLGPSSTGLPPLDEAGIDDLRQGRAALESDDAAVINWSRSRGVRRTPGSLGNKGEIRHEFAELPNPAHGEHTALRTLITTSHQGAAELVIAAPAPLEVRWDGQPLAGAEVGPLRRFPLTLTGPTTHVLEYQVGPSELQTGHLPKTVDTWFTLTEPDAMPELPVFINAAGLSEVDGHVAFSRDVDVAPALQQARLVVGSAAAATVIIDGTVVAEQARVEYYDGSHPSPNFFSHDVTGHLAAGRHRLEVVLETTDPQDPVYIDLGLAYADHVEAVVSDAGWTTSSGDSVNTSTPTRSVWGGLETAQAVRRPHPLPAGAWLRGAPDLGRAPLGFDCTTTVEPAATTLRIELPAGTTRLDVPTRVPATLVVDGEEYEVGGGAPNAGVITLRQAPGAVTADELRFDRAASPRSASLVDVPVFATVGSFDCPLEPWHELALGSWSGGVTYRRSVELTAGSWELQLGDVRGSVHIELDGRAVGDLFCAPFRVGLPVDQPGSHQLSITVFNTLAPFLRASTPTVFAFEEQLPSGLFGPVRLAPAASVDRRDQPINRPASVR